MSLAIERLEFAPPRTPGLIRSVFLALLAHAVLVAVLTVGVAWKRQAPQVTAEAELWSSVPQQAAPPPVAEPPAEPQPEPVKPAPEPEPAPPVAKPVETPDPSIAIAKEKAAKEKQHKLDLQKQAQEKERLAKLEQEKLAKEKLAKEKQAKLDKQAKDQANQLERDKALAAAQKAKDASATAEAKKLQDLREQNLKRLAGLAGNGTGDAGSTGSASQSSAPSASYAGRVRARIKPNITYIETIVGNPTTEIEVRTSPDGTIISSRITKASGTKSWDDAAINAIEKTGILPRDENNRVPSSLIIVLSPQELIGR
jgi:colicin import membrane protein